MGYIGINRKLFEHFLWTEPRKFSRAEAWIDLLQMVSYSPFNEKIIKGTLLKWGRGQFPVSYTFLSHRWSWSVSKVRAFLTLLKNSKQITTQVTNVATVLTICNYDIYNPISQAEQQSEKQSKSRQKAGGRQELKKEKKEEEGKEEEKRQNFIKKQNDEREKERLIFIEELMEGEID